MPRPKGSKNLLTGTTYFFTVVAKQHPSQALTQVAITHTSSGHWQTITYIGGTKQTKGIRCDLKAAMVASGLSEDAFRQLFNLDK